MKKYILYIVFVLISCRAFAQQTPLYSMYMFNEFAVNPAVTSLQTYTKAQVNNRYQFVGIENAPITATITLTGKVKTHPMGWGGMIYNDSQGAFSKFGVYGGYSYCLKTGRNSKLALGLSVGLIKYSVDMTKIRFLEEETNLNESLYSSIRPDATFGLYYKFRRYFIGVSADQLFNNQIDMYDDTLAVDNTLNRFKSHLNIMLGSEYKITRNFISESSIVARKVYASPWQVEVSTRVTYRKSLWGGLSYRTEDAVVLFLGYTYRGMISFGYAYDITYSKLNAGSHGSHEAFLSIKFNSDEEK